MTRDIDQVMLDRRDVMKATAAAAGALLLPAALLRLLTRGREWDLSGLQAILPVPLLRSSTPVEPMCPCHDGHVDAAPATHTAKASAMADFGAHSRSFSTCSPTLRVSCCHSRARLASGWLAGLCREGVEPSGSRRKVSDR